MRVAADKIEMRFEPDIHLDTRLARSAQPVLRSLSEQLRGQSVSVILTDPTGLVLSRLTGDGELERHLDRVLLAPGFSYAEEFVGTNGIGTALEVGGPTHVFGHEHYAENLEELACAGVPIHHPVTGRLVGAVDLTCWRKDAGSLLLTLAKTTAGQIRQALLADASASQMELFQEYLRTCSRTSGIVFALNSDVVMLNDHARATLTPADQSTLLAQAMEARMTRRGTVIVELPSGQGARMHCRRVGEGDQPSGVVAHVVLDATRPRRLEPRRRCCRGCRCRAWSGSGPPWLHACQEVETDLPIGRVARRRGRARSRQARRPPGRAAAPPAGRALRGARGTRRRRPTPTGCKAVRRTLAGDAETVVIRHVDALELAAAPQPRRHPPGARVQPRHAPVGGGDPRQPRSTARPC